jgi:hypothetical protein
LSLGQNSAKAGCLYTLDPRAEASGNFAEANDKWFRTTSKQCESAIQLPKTASAFQLPLALASGFQSK